MELLHEVFGISFGDFLTAGFWMMVGSIVLIDLLLSGDNVVLLGWLFNRRSAIPYDGQA